MVELDLGGRWKRSVKGRFIDHVEVPGSFEPMGECTLEYEFRWTPPENGARWRYFICTDGVLASAEFVLNGKPVGRAGPWVPYRLEIPRGVLRDNNLIAAHVKDMPERFGLTPGRRMDAGLIRGIRLERRPFGFIENLLFRYEMTASLDRALCNVSAAIDDLTPGTSLEAVLFEAETGRQVATASSAAGEPIGFEVREPRLWSPESPCLYRLRVSVHGGSADGDEAEELVGFRTIACRGRDFILNGKRLVLKGVCRHEFIASFPFSPPEDAVERDLALIKHAGFNFVRLVHAPQAAVVPRIAARLGLLVSEEPGACFMDLRDEQIAAAAIESMSATVLRDRNCPSVFAWFIYNECTPCAPYAKRIADAIRALDPSGRPIGMADCSGKIDQVKDMVSVGGLSMYGINLYSTDPRAYLEVMGSYTDRPLVFTEWGGLYGQGNPRTLGSLCSTFVRTTREDSPARIAGSCFWVWQDYPEHTRAEPATIHGWTIEGLIDRQGSAKHDLLDLSMMCFEIDHAPSRSLSRPRMLLQSPARPGLWVPVDLEGLAGDQSALEREIEKDRSVHGVQPPVLGPLLADGIVFEPRHQEHPAAPLLIGGERKEVLIPVNRTVTAIAVLGHVDFRNGYPSSDLFSIHTGGASSSCTYGQAASEYVFEFADGTEAVELRHGEHILRSNRICRWWMTAPRASATKEAIEAVLHPSYEILRIDLWETRLERPRMLRAVRWRLRDPQSIQGMFAMSVEAV
jgi:hypothetical protein